MVLRWENKTGDDVSFRFGTSKDRNHTHKTFLNPPPSFPFHQNVTTEEHWRLWTIHYTTWPDKGFFLSFYRQEMRDGKDALIRKVEQYKPLIVCFNGKGNSRRAEVPSKHNNKTKDSKRFLFIPNSIFLVCFSSILNKFGGVMVHILARCTGWVKIPMAGPNESDMPLKCTIRYY